MREALATHDQMIRAAIEANHGTIFKTGGDSFCAAFAHPEDALAAAIEAQRGLNETTWATESQIRVRMGVHTGTAQLREGDYFGPTLNRAARVMDAGHGGQILASASTQRLVLDNAPERIEMESLGTYPLKGLDRAEEIFQVIAPGLANDFGPLRVAREGAESSPQEAAEAAYQSKRWDETVELLDQLEAESRLTANQHLMYAHSLWWLGKHDDLPRRFETAYNSAIDVGDPELASMAAVELAEIYHHLLSPDISRSWERKAEKHLDALGDPAARGHLLRWQTVRALEVEGDLEKALDLSRQVMELARAAEDGSLEALALQDQGRTLVAMGRTDEGMPLMDEAMLAAVAGDVDPMVVGRSYCNMLAVCERTGDIRRAREWSAAAERWCQTNQQAPYPGICRIFKAEIMWRMGDWVDAEAEVLRASDELGALTDVAGEAFYQYGEMRMRAGDEEAAETAFHEALARGRQPVPGYAMLLAQRGDTLAALEILGRALNDLPRGRLDRVRHLAPLVELLIQAERLDDAETAAQELTEIAHISGSDYYDAKAKRSRGQVELARGDSRAAVASFKDALETMTRLGLRYEAALTHLDLGLAYQAEGSGALATMEIKVAAAELEKLGAASDVKRAASLLSGREST